MESYPDAYLQYLTEIRDMSVPMLDAILRENDLRPVGTGFIDIITQTDRCPGFVTCVSDLGIAIEMVTLWCHCTDENRQRYGCPHGYGGPKCDGGYFSEMCERDSFEITMDALSSSAPGALKHEVHKCNEQAMNYVRDGMKRRSDYSPCFVPGFWLAVPDKWKNSWAS